MRIWVRTGAKIELDHEHALHSGFKDRRRRSGRSDKCYALRQTTVYV
jgi:hypothetical protein